MYFRLIVAALLSILAVVILVRHVKTSYGLVSIKHQGKHYNVRNKQGKEQVAEVLAALESKTDSFVTILKSSTHKDHPKVRRVVERWSGSLSETSPMYDKEAAYTTDKKAISICVRDKEGKVQDQNAAMYIVLHEICHIANPQHGHDREFWQTFRFFLNIAVQKGLYTPETTSTTYCGINVDNSEYWCLQNKTCEARL